MRSADAPHLHRLVTRLYHRLTLVCWIERLAICIGVAATAASILIPITYVRHESAWPLVSASLLIALIAAIAWSVRQPMSHLAAASAVDAQLQLHDLLATALLLANQPSRDPWENTVLAIADARCRTLSASSVILAHLTPRAWTGVGLSTTLLFTLAALATPPASPTADAASAFAVSPRAAASSVLSNTLPLSSSEQALQHTSPKDAQDDAASSMNVPAPSNTRSRDPSSAMAGTGPGMSRTTSNALPQPAPQSTQLTRHSAASGTAAGGDALNTDLSSAGHVAGTIGRTPTLAPAAPWSSSTWPADQAAAQAALRDGHIPDSARDLVREYFNRSER